MLHNLALFKGEVVGQQSKSNIQNIPNKVLSPLNTQSTQKILPTNKSQLLPK